MGHVRGGRRIGIRHRVVVSSKSTAGDLAAGECGANEIDAVEGDNGDNPALLVPIVRTIEMGT